MLPYPWKYPGIFLIIAGTALTLIYYWFDFQFKMPVFAVYSIYMEQKFMTTFHTNFAEEVILMCYLIGFMLLVFSKDRPGQPNFEYLKGKALFRALFYNSMILLLSIVFLYGKAFLAMLVVNIFSLFVLYMIIFSRMKVREAKKT